MGRQDNTWTPIQNCDGDHRTLLDQPLQTSASQEKGLECCIANPYLTSNYLKSLNLPQKTDDIDARGIARFGMERRPEATPPPSREVEELRELSRHRDVLVKTKTAFGNRRESRSSESARNLNKAFIKTIEGHIARTEKLMKKLARQIPWVKEQMELMMSVPGVGEITAIGLSVEIGDFKQYTRKGISAASGCRRVSVNLEPPSNRQNQQAFTRAHKAASVSKLE